MPDGSIKAFSPDRDPIVQYVNDQMERYVRTMREMAEEMQHALQHISDELADEIVREQKHLVLMQDQVGPSLFRGASHTCMWV
jgi:flagellar biosynthesis/type III secretory pathway chaperone